MKITYRSTVMATALAGAVFGTSVWVGDAHAQGTGPLLNADSIAAMTPAMLAQVVATMNGDQLVETLEAASSVQRAGLVAAIAPSSRTLLLTNLLQSGASAGLLADIIAAMIVADPNSAAEVIELVQQNAPAELLEPLAEAIWAATANSFADLSQDALTGLVRVTLVLNPGTAFRIVRFGNTLEPAQAARLARALVDVGDSVGGSVASSIDLALGLEGGIMARLVGALRGEVEVAAVPEQPVLPPTPTFGPAGIGGGGATPGGERAGAGRDSIFSQSGSNPGGGSSFPGIPGRDVSP